MNRKHVFFWKLLRNPVRLFLWLKFGYTCRVAKDLPETYIVLANHTTDYDPLFVASSFPRQMYFVGSEHISRWKLAYQLLKFAFAPIMRPKGTVGVTTTMDVLRKVKSGANVCIFAEGERCWDGVTAPILPSTGKTIKTARCGLVTYKIVGGYFASPNWSGKNTRRGYVHGEVANVYTKEDIAKMSVDEINEVIARDLYEDAYERQLQDPKPYRGRNLAERMETLLYVCPRCGQVDTIRSHGDTVECCACGMNFRYDEYGMLRGGDFRTVRELFLWQKDEVQKAAEKGVVYTAPGGTLKTVQNQVESMVDSGAVTMTAETLICGNTTILLEDIADMGRHGKQALVFSTMRTYYELIPENANALKFLMLFKAYKAREKSCVN